MFNNMKRDLTRCKIQIWNWMKKINKEKRQDMVKVLTIFADGADVTHAVLQVIAAYTGAAVSLSWTRAHVTGGVTPEKNCDASDCIITASNVKHYTAILTFDKISGHLHYLTSVLPNSIPHCSRRRSATPRSNSLERTHYTLPCLFLKTARTVMG